MINIKNKSALNDKKRALVASMLQKNGFQSGVLPIPCCQRSEITVFPASYAQQRMWFFHQLDPRSTAYNVPMAFSIKGEIDVQSLKESFEYIVDRHEVFRTVFRFSEGCLVQVVSRNAEVEFPILCITVHEDIRTNQQINELIQTEATTPFDLVSGPPIRFSLVNVDRETHVLLITVHHIVFDGTSIGILLNDLRIAYNAIVHHRAVPLPRPYLHYGDYAQWEQHKGQDNDDLRYWISKLSGPLSVLGFPVDHPRTILPT